jgi:hypothetical protein
MSELWAVLFLLSLALFLGFESYALVRRKTTFSMWIRNHSTAWPQWLRLLAPLILGVLGALLAIHLWWV